MKVTDLIEHCARTLAEDSRGAAARDLDKPISVPGGRQLATAGTLFLYSFDLPADTTLREDLPVSIVPSDDLEPTEGFVIGQKGQMVLVQTFESLGQTTGPVTIVPDATGLFDTVSRRLAEMKSHSDRYTLGPAERLVPWLHPDETVREQAVREAVSSAAFGTVWHEDLTTRRARLALLAVELIRANKKLLLISPDHRRADEIAGIIARTLKHVPLPYKSLMTRYELPIQQNVAGIPLPEVAFEAQMHQFYAKSRADKASLRRKYERFRELTPLLAYKAEKQRDLNEVKLLEWRLITEVTELRDKIKDINETLASYESLPLAKRLAMQAIGKNTTTLVEYKAIYEQQIRSLTGEMDKAKQRIEELTPEAAIPKDIKPEYKELKDEIKRLGGTKKIRDLLAAEEGTNRQAFLQNKRLVVTTAARVAVDPLFGKVRFDVLLVDEAPWIPAAYLLASAGLVRERIVLSGDTKDITASKAWETAGTTASGRK